MKRIYNIAFWMLTMTALPAFAQETAPINVEFDNAVKDVIMSLPEVKAKDKVYDSITSRVQRIILHVTAPDAVTGLYKVEAGYQGSNRFQPHFYFYVNMTDKVIYIEDLEQGDRTTLEEWRRRRANTAASN